MNCYSDNGVDKFLINTFPPESFGYACEVGANTGTAGSNTLALEQQGWMVLCVEPNPMLEPEGRAARKIWRQVACGAEDDECGKFLAFGSHPYASYSGMDDRYGGGIPTSMLSVKVRTLDRLLEEAGFPRLDALTIDAEGYEDEVLKGFTVERWKPRYIVVEDCDGSSVMTKYQIPNGYEEMPRCHFDRIWRRNV
jgi:FkbM family methyltransferase